MDNVHVAIRVRPLITRESSHDVTLYWKVENNSICQVDSKNKVAGKPYTFDYVFHMDQSTSDVYTQVAKPIIESAMDGYDGTIFAYGQTSSGKTFTMQGHQKEPGIIPRAVDQIFGTIDKSPDREFLLRVCYMEIYNEVITDLLCKDGKGLSIREQEKRVFVSGLTEEVVNNADKILELMKKGDQQRHVGRTNMNEHSSRSHSIFCIVIESRERTNNQQSDTGAVKVSRLNLVDLAGSERLNDTKAEGMRLKEACKINQSLFALGQVINKLSSGVEYIPFRDSKLTRILQPSLGGNAKTAIICTVTPAAIDQTQNTLQFASRAKTIKNKPEMHEILSDEALLRRYKSEIEKLKKQIDQYNNDKLKDGWESLQNEKKQMAEESLKLIEARNRLENMVISGQDSHNQKTKKRPNRRETWCPGTRKFPLLATDPIAAAAAVSAEVGTLDVSDYKMTPKATITSSSSSSSISSDEFSESKLEIFTNDCAMSSEDDVPKKKRRRAVHFSEIPCASLIESDGVGAAEVACQTEDMVSSHEELQESIIICEALMEEKDLLKKDNELMQEQISQIKEENREVNAKCIEIQLECDQVKLELKHVREEYQELKEFTSFEQKVTDDHYKDIEETHQTAIKELNETIEVRENEIRKFRRSVSLPPSMQLSAYLAEKELLTEKIKDLEKSLEDAETIIMDTNKSLSDMTDRNVHLEQEMESLKKSIQQLENEKSDLDACLEIQKEKSDRMSANLRSELQMTYNQLAEVKGEEVNDLPKSAPPSLRELQETIEKLTKESEALKEDLQLSITSSVEVQEDLINCQEELEARSLKCKTLQSEMASLQEELKRTRSLAEERCLIQSEEDLQGTLDAKEQECEALNIKVVALQNELKQALIATGNTPNEQNGELQNKLDAKTQECESLNAMITSLNEDLKKAVAVTEVSPMEQSENCELQDIDNDSKMLSLQGEVEEAVEKPPDNQSAIPELQARLDTKTQECETLNYKMIALHEELEQAWKMSEETTEEHLAILKMNEILDAPIQECKTLKVNKSCLQEELEPVKNASKDTLQEHYESHGLQKNLDSSAQEIMTPNTSVITLQEGIEQAAESVGKTPNDVVDVFELQTCLNARTLECKALNGMVVSLEEQLEKAKMSTEINSVNATAEPGEDDQDLKIFELEQQLKVSKEYEIELESEIKKLESKIEMLKEQIEVFNDQENLNRNLRENLVDVSVGTESKVSDMENSTATTKENEAIKSEEISSEEDDKIPVCKTYGVAEEPNNDQNINENTYLDSNVTELQENLSKMSERLTEMSQKLEDSEEMLKIAKEYESELESQLKEACKSKELEDGNVQTLQDQMKILNSEKSVLQKAMAETESKLAEMESKIAASEAMFTEIESKLAESEAKLADMTSHLADSEAKFDQLKVDAEMEKRLMIEQSMSTDLMSTQLETYRQSADRAKGALIAESNRELDQQRRIESLQNAQKESVAVFQQSCKEKDEVIAGLEKKATDLLTKLRQAEAQSDQATHRCLQMERECQDLKESVKELENHAFKSTQSSYKQEMDPAKLTQRMKQLEFNLDITKQKADKFEKLNKELRDSNKKYEANEFKASNLEKQLRDVNFEFERERTEFSKLKSRYDNLIVEVAEVKHRLAKSELKNAGVDTERMKNDLCTLEKENLEMKEKLTVTDQKLLQFENAMEVEKKRYEQVQHDMKDVQDELQYCKATIHELESEREHLRSKMEKDEKHFNGLCQRYEDEVESCKKELTKYQEKLEEAKLKNNEYNEKLRELEQQVEVANKNGCQDCEALRQDKDQYQNELQSCKAMIHELESEREHLRSKLEKDERHFNGLCQEYEDEVESCKKKLTNYQEQLEEAKFKNDEYNEKLKEMEQSNDISVVSVEQKEQIADKEVCQECVTLRHNQDQYEIQIKELQTERDEVASQIKQQAENLNSMSLEKDGELRRLNEELAQHVDKYQQMTDELQSCKAMIHELESEREHLRSKMEKDEKHFNGLCQEYEDEVESCKKELTNYQEQLEEVKLKNYEYNERLKEVEQSNDISDATIEQQEEVADKEVCKDCEALRQDKDQYQVQIRELQTERDELTLQMKQQFEDLNTMSQEKDDELKRLNEKIAQHVDKYQQLTEDAGKHIIEIEKLKEERDVAYDRLHEQETEGVHKLDNIHQELEHQSMRHRQEIDALKVDAAKYLTEIEKLKEEKDLANERLQQHEVEASQKVDNIHQEIETQSTRHQQEIDELKEDALKYMTEIEKLKEEKDLANERLKQHEVEASQKVDNIHQEIETQSTRHQQEIDELKEDALKYMTEIEKLKEEKDLANERLKQHEIEALQKVDNIHQEIEMQLTRHQQEIDELKEDVVKYMTEVEKLKEERDLADHRLREQEIETAQRIDDINQELAKQTSSYQLEMNALKDDAVKYMVKMEELKEERDLANNRLQEQKTEAACQSDNLHQELAQQSAKHQQEIETFKRNSDALTSELASLREMGEAAVVNDCTLKKACSDLKLELEQEQEQNRGSQEALKEEQDKCSLVQSKYDSVVEQFKLLRQHYQELTELCEKMQEEQEEEERNHKETKAKLTQLEAKYSSKFDSAINQNSQIKKQEQEIKELHDKLGKEKQEAGRRHKQMKEKLSELEATVEEKNKTCVDNSTLKDLQQHLMQKKMKIVTLESDILKCTDPLEKRISQLSKELAESSEKVESWKSEAKRLRQQSLDSSVESNTSSKTEAGYGSGIIQECAVFALKAEKAKLEGELKRLKAKLQDLEKKYNEKCIFYQEEITRNTRLRAELKRYVEKASKKQAPVKIQDGTQKRPLNDLPRNSPIKKALKLPTSEVVKESLPTSSSTKKTRANDWDNFLQPAIEKLNEEEKPQQCAQQ
ncbi:centromere-associated protein E-like isoform X4 [Anneissia japonica]|uniref:centromere-associated protein E-like isoform X4 n=1 Tax=Anneissia japonica TaxID=1529436 RepID=UPI001425BA67|nr:centromere-associated protein E-like isoform X4 [Anneissia japonica]